MPFQHILERIRCSPWFCTPGAYQAMSEVVDACLKRAESGQRDLSPMVAGIDFSQLRSRKPMEVDPQTGIARIHVMGLMGRNLAPIENMCGRTDYADIERELEKAQATARGVLLEFDTSGGSAIGVDQAARAIANVRIPSVGYTETVCASAGVYLAAGVDRFFAAGGSMVGSIGTVLPWSDTSKMASILGIKSRVFTNAGASLKGMRSEIELTEEQVEHLQQFVDDLGAQFQTHVENHRKVDPEVYKAGSYMAHRAKDLGLVDELGGASEAVAYLLTKI